MANNPAPATAGNKWAASQWTEGPVTLFQALGIKANIQYPQFQPELAEQAAAASGGPTSSGSTATGAPAATGSCTAAQTKANQALAKQLAASYGWSTGQQWDDLNNIVMAESGWCNTAQNPSSTAYGIAQFLNTTWAEVGLTKTSSPTSQINGMLQYIKQSYGTPSAAWSFHLANGYY